MKPRTIVQTTLLLAGFCLGSSSAQQVSSSHGLDRIAQASLAPVAGPGFAPDGKKPAYRTVFKRPPIEMNPNAKWSCDQTEITNPPVWRDSDTLVYDFYIVNEGTEDLEIRAKGG